MLEDRTLEETLDEIGIMHAITGKRLEKEKKDKEEK
jgi:hypothetical protein